MTASKPTEDEAWDWIAATRTDTARGSPPGSTLGHQAAPPAGSLRFDDLCHLFKVHKLNRWRAGSLRFFDGHYLGVLKPRFGQQRIADITTAELQLFLDDQLARIATAGPRVGQRVSAGTVQKYQKILAEVFLYAVRMGYLKASPMAGVIRVRSKPPPPRILRLHELQAILAHCPAEHRSFIHVLVLTGLRKSELFRMRWDWIDLERNRLLIKEAKTGHQELPLSPRVRAALVALGVGASGHVFPGTHRDQQGAGRVDEEKALSNKRVAIAAALDAAGVDPAGVAFHTFRRSFITMLDELPSVPYGVVRALARHTDKSADMTTRYLYPSDDQLIAAQAQLEARLFGRSNVVAFPGHSAGVR